MADDDLRFGDVKPSSGGRKQDPVDRVVGWIRLAIVLFVFYIVMDALLTQLLGFGLPYGI